MFSFVHAQGAREKVFPKDWIEKNVESYHKSFMGHDSPAPILGYPDMGAGKFSR